MQDMKVAPKTVYVDLGYRGVDAENSQVEIVHRGKSKRLGIKAMSKLRRLQAIEPVIGHLKSDHRMDRCHLKGNLGDSLHAVLCAAGYNIRWLMRMILKSGIRYFLRLIFGPMTGLFGGLLGSKVRKPTMFPWIHGATPSMMSFNPNCSLEIWVDFWQTTKAID